MSTVAERLLKSTNGGSDSQSPKRFRYTRDNNRLTEEQRSFYEKNGYIVFKQLVPGHLLDRWSQHFRDICEGKVDSGRMLMMKDVTLIKTGATGERLYNKIQDFMWDEVLWEFISFPQILQIVEAFTGPNMMAMHTMLINKPPDAGSETSRHPLHQDLHYFPFRPADSIVCCWTAMENITRENGCLVVVPGSHRGRLYPHEYPQWEGGVNKAYHGVQGFDFHDRVHLVMDKGDTVFFHPILVHGSGANRTQVLSTEFRCVFFGQVSCHYAAAECNYIDVVGTTQVNIAEEVQEIAAKKGLPNTDYKEIWHYRSRLVKGKEGKL